MAAIASVRRWFLPSAAALALASCVQVGALDGESAGAGWGKEEQRAWASGTQGSRLLPLAWFKALAQPGNSAEFADPAYLAKFRIVSQPGTLPIGFAADNFRQGPHLLEKAVVQGAGR